MNIPPGDKIQKKPILIGITGPCGAGKSTLATGLERAGYRARAIVQEHSYVPDMWQRLTKPDVLVFLQASREAGASRRRLDWTAAEWEEQQRRLAHARQHADLIVDTERLRVEAVLQAVMVYLKGRRL